MFAPRQSSVSPCALAKRKRDLRHLHLERLEPRLLLAGDTDASELAAPVICHCPVCAGLANADVPTETVQESSDTGPAAAGLAVPSLSSRPDAPVTIYLDFDGHFEASWSTFSNIVSPVFDKDGDQTSFSASELTAINDIFCRVAEDFAPFNVNVTTVEPSSFADGVAIRVVIGGGWADWYGQQAGGVSQVGGFSNGGSNVVYVFENDLGNGFARWTAEAVSHEAGHAFGLSHQAAWNGEMFQSEYNTGVDDWAPIMGNGNFAQRTSWHNGATAAGHTAFEDELAILESVLGYVADDHGGGTDNASVLPIEGTSVNIAGLVGQNGDFDVFEFVTAGGDISFSLTGARVGTNLDSVLELWDTTGNVLMVASDSASYGSVLTATVSSGRYFLVVRSSGGYGNLGAYKLTGTVVPGVLTAPEIQVHLDGAEFASGGTLFFGATPGGTPVSRTVTVTNVGDADLTLASLAGVTLPAGYTLTQDLGDLLLAPGESTTFVIELNASSVGLYTGTLVLHSDDGDEGEFTFHLDGSVTDPPPPPEPVIQTIDNGDDGFSTTGKWHRQKNKGGFERDLHFANRAGKRDRKPATATWTFAGLEAGDYRVTVSFPKSPSYASNAPFSVLDGDALLSTILVNQRGKSSRRASACDWTELGTFTIQGGTLVVQLSNRANQHVVADAVRIERIFETSAAALPGYEGDSTPSAEMVAESLLPEAVVLSLVGETGSTGDKAASLASGSTRAFDYWHQQVRERLAPERFSIAAAGSHDDPDALPELSLLSEATSLLDELAADLAAMQTQR